MPEHSAGILLFRRTHDRIEVLLAHPGGPFWASKDEGSWSIPKGLYEPGAEEPLDAARREFEEETGRSVDGRFWDLGEIRQPSRKRVRVFAAEGDLDLAQLVSNTFEMEWPRGSGKRGVFPEIDRAGWFSLDQAREKILNGQAGFLDRLEETVG